MTKVLVTGAAGFAGSCLVKHLVEAGNHVKGLVRLQAGAGSM